MTSISPIVIIGSGLAGYSLAREIRKLDKQVPLLILTADDGHSYSKPMLSTGFAKNKSADELSMASAEKMADQLQISVRTFTTVTRLAPDEHAVYIGEEKLDYQKLILAWGADVIRLDIPGSGQNKIFSINNLMDYRRFREALEGVKKVLIMGSGLIGCEFANDLIHGGYEVDLVAPSSMAFESLLPKPVALAVTRSLKEAGVQFHFKTVVQKVENYGQGVRAELSNGSKIETDVVLSAVGLRPRIQLAKEAGIQASRGIEVNRALETSAKDIYAFGDCATVDTHLLMFVLPLMACARELAKTLTSTRSEVSYVAMPLVTKTPACPAVMVPPPAGCEGDWQFEANGNSIKGLFYAPDGILLGYVLTADFVGEKQALTKQVPPIHSS